MGLSNTAKLSAGDKFTDLSSGGIYEAIKLLGEGGLGSAYLVSKDSYSVQSVAKIPLQTGDFQSDQYSIKKLNHEADILESLKKKNVPNIVQIEDHFDTEINGYKIPVLILELAKGKTCEDYLLDHDPCVAEDDVKEVLKRVGEALVGVHKEGIIHRDIKPENVFVDNNLNVTLIDFGIAAVFDNSKTTQRATRIGTDFYSPPEQMESGIVSFSSDVFALAATGFYLLTGGAKVGWIGKYEPKMFEKLGHPISQELSDVICKATWPDMLERYATIEDFIQALEGRPPIHKLPRIVVDGTSYPIDKDLITIGRAGEDAQVDIGVTERTADGEYYISRNHCYIKKCNDGYIRIFDGSPDGKASTNYTIWLDKINKWRFVLPAGLMLGSIPLTIGLGFKQGRSSEKDIWGNPILPGAYRVIEYRPPDEYP